MERCVPIAFPCTANRFAARSAIGVSLSEMGAVNGLSWFESCISGRTTGSTAFFEGARPAIDLAKTTERARRREFEAKGSLSGFRMVGVSIVFGN